MGHRMGALREAALVTGFPWHSAQQNSITVSPKIQPSASLSHPLPSSWHVLWLSGDFQIQKSLVPFSADIHSTSQQIRRSLLPHGGGRLHGKEGGKMRKGSVFHFPRVMASLECQSLPSMRLVSRTGPLVGCTVGWQRSGWVPLPHSGPHARLHHLGPILPLWVREVLCPVASPPGGITFPQGPLAVQGRLVLALLAAVPTPAPLSTPLSPAQVSMKRLS